MQQMEQRLPAAAGAEAAAEAEAAAAAAAAAAVAVATAPEAAAAEAAARAADCQLLNFKTDVAMDCCNLPMPVRLKADEAV